MKLFEIEAKDVLADHGILVPGRPGADEKCVVKAQILANDRKEKGAVKFASDPSEAEEMEEQMLGTSFDGMEVSDVLVERRIEVEKQYYVSFLYETEEKSPIVLFSAEGGSDVESRDPSRAALSGTEPFRFRDVLRQEGVESDELRELSGILSTLFRTFLDEDARMLEVNPLAKTSEGYVALDAMMDLEDDASFRRQRDFEDRSATGREPTERERRAREIDEDDHRGVAGKYFEMDGEIGMMLAGGGASLTNMDALIALGGSPANYTEYGGNPPEEKVYRLSKVVMSKELEGLWHVGGTANNTDVYRTMKGFVRALEELEPEYPIVVRRDGPNAVKAFNLLRQKREELDLDMRLFRNDKPMTESAEDLMEMVRGEQS